jgi:hypothetical protein
VKATCIYVPHLHVISIFDVKGKNAVSLRSFLLQKYFPSVQSEIPTFCVSPVPLPDINIRSSVVAWLAHQYDLQPVCSLYYVEYPVGWDDITPARAMALE